MLQPGTVINGKYEIIKIVGKGGMSAVYQARDRATGRILAIKDALRNDNQVTEQSLAAEGRVLMGLSNPHLPHIYDIIENKDSIMLVMDFVEGNSLDKILANHGARPVENAILWGMQVCQVFDYLHHQPQPIIYRDMKPANLILQSSGNIMVIDFGTARTQKVNANLSSDTINIGTAGFAAPEQYGGMGQSDARTDIFCLGATLYNIVTGHSPSDPPRGVLPLETWVPELANSPIQEIIRKATRNDPNERYQTAMEFYQDLHLASIGAYQTKGKSGKSGQLGGGWQSQKIKTPGGGISGGLSGLLKGTGLLSNNQNNGKTGGWMKPNEQKPAMPQNIPGGMGNPNGNQNVQKHQMPPQVPYTPPQPYTPPAPVHTPAPVYTPPASQQAYAQPIPAAAADDGEMNRKIALIAAVVAAGFLILTILFAVVGLLVVSLVCVFFALGAVVLALVEALMGKGQSQQ